MGHNKSAIPPRPPTPPPPLPPPPPSVHVSPTAVSSKSKSKSQHGRHVSFGPRSTKSSSPFPPPPPPPPPPALSPNNTSGEVTYQQLPTLEIQTNPNGGPGYIRLQGGIQTTRYHHYDAHIPTCDLLAADVSQQTSLINAMIASQIGTVPQGQYDAPPPQQAVPNLPRDSGRVAEVHEPEGHHHSNHQSSGSRHGSKHGSRHNSGHGSKHGQSSHPHTKLPALTAANLQASNHNNMRALTSVSRCLHANRPAFEPPGEHEVSEPSSDDGTAVPAVPKRTLKCCNCGEVKRHGVENVKVIKNRVQICWRCLVRADGENAVRRWVAASD